MPRSMTVKNSETGQTVTFDWNDDDNDPTDADLEEVFAAAGPPPAPRQPSGRQVAADEPDTYLGGAVKGFREGVLGSPVGKALNFVSDAFESSPPIAGTKAIVGAVTPAFVKETRLPTAREMRGAAASGAALLGSAGTIAASPFSGGSTLAATIPVSGAASYGTARLLGADEDEATEGAAIDAAGAGVPLLGRALSGGGRSLIRSAFGFRRGQGGEAIEESIRSGINATRGGMDKAGQRINQIAKRVNETVNLLDNGGLKPETGLKNMEALLADMQRPGGPGASEEQVNAVRNLIDTYRTRYGQTPYTPSAAHAQKKALYEPIENTFMQDAPSFPNQAKQAFARGFRQDVEDAARREGLGETVALENAQIGRLKELETQLAKQPGRNVGPYDIVLGALNPKLEAAKLAWVPGVRSTVGRGLAQAGDVIGAVTDPFVQGAARLGGTTLGARSEARAAAKEAAVIGERGATVQAARAAHEAARPARVAQRQAQAVAGATQRNAARQTEAERVNQEIRAAAERFYGPDTYPSTSSVGSIAQPHRGAAFEGLPVPQSEQTVLKYADGIDAAAAQRAETNAQVGYSRHEQPDMFGGDDTVYPGRPEPDPQDVLIPPRNRPDPGPTAEQLEAHRVRVPERQGPQWLTVEPEGPATRGGQVYVHPQPPPGALGAPARQLGTGQRLLGPGEGIAVGRPVAGGGDPVTGAAGRPRPSQPTTPRQTPEDDAAAEVERLIQGMDQRPVQNVSYEQQLDEGGPIANSSGVTDVSREAVNAADQWEYFAVRPGARPKPLGGGIRPEDAPLNPGWRLARRPKGTFGSLSLY